MIDKILVYIRRGYGLAQLMEELNLEQSAILELMEKDNSFKNKMFKRFSDKWLKAEEIPASEKTPAINDFEGTMQSSLSLEELKKRADILKIEYNGNIGAKKLRERIEALLTENPEAVKLLHFKQSDAATDEMWKALIDRAAVFGLDYVPVPDKSYEDSLAEVEELEAEAKKKKTEGGDNGGQPIQ